MDDNDHLKVLLNDIDRIHAPIDLEAAIIKAIRKEERSRHQIEQARARGVKALLGSGMLTVILIILFSWPAHVRSVEHAVLTYSSISVALTLLFVQLEIGRGKLFNDFKNNSLS